VAFLFLLLVSSYHETVPKKLPKSCKKVVKKLSKSCQKSCQKMAKLKIGCEKTKILKRVGGGGKEGGGGGGEGDL
jgi:hypothetical protein